MVVEEERVVRQRRHVQADLLQVVEVLQDRRFSQVDAVRDVLGEQKRRGEVVDVASLPRVRPERYGVQPLALPKLVQGVQISVHVIGVIRKGWVVGHVPFLRRSHVLRRPSLGF